MQQSQNLSLKDRVYLQVRYGLDSATLRSITRLGLNRDQAVRLVEERSKRGLPPVSVWSSSSSPI
ncbi:hypothetical protein FJY69_08080 [candidate division WOR-3 bacterium]|nr:hypothetical protein [candidate division WOR-3 bacterium]